jgi:hypothetical protein
LDILVDQIEQAGSADGLLLPLRSADGRDGDSHEYASNKAVYSAGIEFHNSFLRPR